MNSQPWFKHYDQGVPHTLAPYPERTLIDVFSESVNSDPIIERCCSKAILSRTVNWSA